MHQYNFEEAGNHHSVRSPSTEPRQSERRLVAVPESSTTPARKIAMPVSPVSMKTLGELAAQPNGWASLLQLQRQHGNQFVQRFVRIARTAEGDGPVTPKVERGHVVQQTSETASSTSRSSALQRKVILKGAEMPAKDRRAFLKGHQWSNASRAAAIMEDMAAAGNSFDFADEGELKSEIDKRLSTVAHMEESQQTVEKMPGDKRAAFGYPFTGASAVYGPRVNYAAREYWEQATPDNYAERKDKAKNKELMSKPRHQRCTVYGDQCDPYIWKLSDKGKKDPYHAIAYLFVPQPPSKRALLHCDYLISLVN